MIDFQAKPNRRFAKTVSVLVAAATALAVGVTVRAADLEVGEWAGTIAPPGGDATPAVFTVGEADGQTRISVSVMGMTYDFSDVEVTNDALLFSWMPGPVVDCELALQEDNSYEGECAGADGRSGYMTMVPPE